MKIKTGNTQHEVPDEVVKKILFEFYDFVLDEHGGDLHEYQLSEFIEQYNEQ